jgi:hypothetical protein
MRQFASCFYFGEVVHQRYAPRRHRLRYQVFQGLFDLDELPSLNRKLRFFSHNRTNVFAFHDADHGDGRAGSLRAYIEDLLKQAGLSAECDRIRLLCMPRILGFVFNPLSVYFCYISGDELIAVVYEVNNTFGQRHSYLIPVGPEIHGRVQHTCKKGFFVSPFMDMDMTYEFKLTLPAATLATCINGNRGDGAPLIFASFTGSRRELSDHMILTALVAYPLLTLGVIAAIHWEAVKLLAKGLRLRPRPSPPPFSVTVVEPRGATPNKPSQSEAFNHLHKMDKQSA